MALNQHMKNLYMGLVGITLEKGDNLIKALLPEKQEDAKAIYDRVIRTNQWKAYETTYFKDGTYRHFLVNVKPIQDGKKVMRICISAMDITERKNAVEQLVQLNENLLKQARELAISNADLEQFAYVASHDLQEPLRMVTSFMNLLEKKYGDVVDDMGRKYIYYAVDGAKRMRQIILDLLDFSRVGRTKGGQENVNINKLVDEIFTLDRGTDSGRAYQDSCRRFTNDSKL